MFLNSHRVIGIIHIEAPLLEIAGCEDDDSTIGGLLAGFAQRSLFEDAACLSRLSANISSRSAPYSAKTATLVSANVEQLKSDLDAEFWALSEVSA
jgi:hypothetical protein